MPSVDVLRQFVERSPNDPFPRYGLAMELKNAGRLDEAVAEFAELERRFPEYVAQYLMHQQVLVALGRPGDARAVIERGIAAARKKGDGHALSELEGALDQLS